MEPQNSGKIDIEIPPSSVPNPTPEPTTAAPAQAPANEPPKITGLSSSISKNNEISGKALPPSTVINRQPEPSKQPVKKRVQLPPPTEEEINNYIKKKRTRKAIILAVIFVLLAAAAITAAYFILEYLRKQDSKHSDGYSVDYPYIIENSDGTEYLADKNGKKISGDYARIEEYYEGFTVACKDSNCDILDTNGNIKYSGQQITKIENSSYFLEKKDNNQFSTIIKTDGKALNDEKVTSLEAQNGHSFMLTKDPNAKSFKLLSSEGKSVATGETEDTIVSQKLEISYSKYEDKYYCAASTQTRGNEYKTRFDIYNCESGKSILSLDNVGNSWENKRLSDNIFKAADTSYVIYNDELVLKTDLTILQSDNGLVYGQNPEEGFELFNPRTKNNVDESSNGLIDEGKYDIAPKLGLNDYFDYANYRESGYEFFKNNDELQIYKDGKKKDIRNAKMVFSEELFNYLHFKNKDYVIVEENGKTKLYDMNKSQTIDLGGNIESPIEYSCLVVVSTDDIHKKKIYNLITGENFEISLQDGEHIVLARRELIIESIITPSEADNSSSTARKMKYYSQTGKLLAEISYNIDGE